MNAVAEEGALERVALAGANHLSHADVGGQLHVLAAVGVGAAVDVIGKSVPFVCVTDDVRVGIRSSAIDVVNQVSLDALCADITALAGENQRVATRGADADGECLYRLAIERDRVVGVEVECCAKGWVSHDGVNVDGVFSHNIICFHAADGTGL